MVNPLSWLRPLFAKQTPPGQAGQLNGYFAVGAERISGVVRAPFMAKGGTVDVQFVLRGVLVARCTAAFVIDHNCYEFALPGGGWFKLADVLDDSLEVHAIAPNGATGTLQPHGQTGLRAIREHLTESEDVLLDLTFGRDGTAAPHLREGWGKPEAAAAWTVGAESVLQFDAPAERGNYVLGLTATPFFAPPDVPRQEADVLLNEVYVTSFTYLRGGEQYHEVRIDPDLMASSPVATVRLRHLYAARPSDLGKPDNRLIALRVARLRLTRRAGTAD